MSDKNKHITVFEYQSIKLNQIIDEVKFDEQKLKAFQSYYGNEGVPYFSLIHNGIKFNSFVGVIQVGNTVIEVLPKADNTFEGEEEKPNWRNILIDMLHAVGIFTIHAPSSSSLKLKSNSILDLYLQLFITEVEYLFHTGLVKKYRKKEGNVTALKGSLQFGKHIQQNLTHQERFYVRYTTYDKEHLLHSILYKTIQLLKQINTNTSLHSRIGSLLLNFPEMPDVKVSETTFDRIVYNRKTQSYRKSIEIARLLLLQYHPDISKGRNNVLALMFDMNKLWEQFVLVSLRKNRELKVKGQDSKYFWKPVNGNRRTIRPDITIKKDEKNYVLDTKWKLVDKQPSIEDVRQMYAYHHYFNAEKVALLYPGAKDYISGKFIDTINQNSLTALECGLIFIDYKTDIKEWQIQIGAYLQDWINNNN